MVECYDTRMNLLCKMHNYKLTSESVQYERADLARGEFQLGDTPLVKMYETNSALPFLITA